MKQHEVIENLKDAFLAGYYRGAPMGGKHIWELDENEKKLVEIANAAAYEWARSRLAVLMNQAIL